MNVIVRMSRVMAGAAVLVAAVHTAGPAEAEPTAADCTWQATYLAVPAGFNSIRVTGQHDDDVLVGMAWRPDVGGYRGVVWDHGRVTLLPDQPADVSTFPLDINSSGTVTGYQSVPDDVDGIGNNLNSFRYSGGAYETLSEGTSLLSYVGWWVNGRGDVAESGAAWEDTFTMYIPGDPAAPRQRVWDGRAVGIDDTGRVVTSEGVIWSPGGAVIDLDWPFAGTPTPVVFQNGRIVGGITGGDADEIVEWNTDGEIVRRIPTSAQPRAITSAGTVLSTDGDRIDLWRGTDADLFTSTVQPVTRYYLGISDEGIITGNSTSPTGGYRPTQWQCVP